MALRNNVNRKARRRVYLETTMFNYYFDEERDGHADTVRMFEAVGRGEYEGYTSEYAIIELQRAKERKSSDMSEPWILWPRDF
jgi:predicted nucleic acid-binding protein